MTRSASIQNPAAHRTLTSTQTGLRGLGLFRVSAPLAWSVVVACGFVSGTLRADEKIIISAPEKAITTPAAESKGGERPSSTTRELLKGVSTGDLDAPSFVQPSGGLLLDAKSQKALLDILTKKKNSESLVPDDDGFERNTADSKDEEFEPDFQDDSDRRDASDRLENRTGLRNDKRDVSRTQGVSDRDRSNGRDRDQRRDRDGRNGNRVLPTLGETPLVLTPESMAKSGNRAATLDSNSGSERIRISSPGDIQGALDGDRDLGGSLGIEKPDVGALSGVKDMERQQSFRQMLTGPKPGEGGGVSKAQIADPFGSGPDRQSQFQSLLNGTPSSSASALPSGALPVNLSPPTALSGAALAPSAFSLPGSVSSGFAPGAGSLLPAPLPTPSAGPAGLRSQPIVLPIPRRF